MHLLPINGTTGLIPFEHLSLYIQKHLGQSAVAVRGSLWKGIIWRIIWGMSEACLGQHLGHIVNNDNNGQQSAVLHASVMPFLYFSCLHFKFCTLNVWILNVCTLNNCTLLYFTCFTWLYFFWSSLPPQHRRVIKGRSYYTNQIRSLTSAWNLVVVFYKYFRSFLLTHRNPLKQKICKSIIQIGKVSSLMQKPVQFLAGY